MKLIIIDGLTSTGKSRLARRLAKDLRVRAVCKDDYKERQFDALGRLPNLRQMAKIENDSWDEIFRAVEAAIKRDESLLIEGNFFRRHRRRLAKLLQSNAIFVEVFCYARGSVILRRYINRMRSGERHPGHRDYLFYWICALECTVVPIVRRHRPFRLSPHTLLVDMTDFKSVDYAAIRLFISSAE